MMKEDERKTFRKWLSDICTASTVSEYRMICNNIEKKVEQYKMEGWWRWWKVRRFHIVPALHGFDLPRMNLAEVGHSSMKRHRPMWLSQVVNDDCIHFLIQEANYNKFLNNSDKVRGKGPTQFDRDQNDQNAEKKFISLAIESIRTGSFFHDQEEFVSPDVSFKPSCKAKHRAPRDIRAGVQHYHVPHKVSHNRSPSKKLIPIPVPIATSTPKKLPHRAGRGRNPKYDSDFHDFLEPNDYDLVP